MRQGMNAHRQPARFFVPLQGVSNRDLKLENLMLCRNGGPGGEGADRPLLKVGDFG